MNDWSDILHTYWGYPDFRGIQRDIIESIAGGHDTLGLMPTGGGKSLTFQVPALAMEGVCLVITPLVALMKDQTDHLRERGIRADAIYASRSRQENIRVLEDAIFGGIKILYVSPERLSSRLFQTKLRHMKVSFITVDEAHCISQWGYDFRPSYLEISRIRQLCPGAPVLALTATATPQVVEDIQDKLAFRERRVFRMSFRRENLAYVVREAMDKQEELIHILRTVKGSAIVYVRSRQHTKDVAGMLNGAGINATYYHAGLETPVKNDRQDCWQRDEVRVMVATNAFGMGIDKPDVRLVVHMDCPDSLEAYFQEAGRAGRDGQRAYAVLLWNGADDRKLDQRIENNFPTKEYIADVYEHLAYFFQLAVGDGYGVTREFNIDLFCQTYHYFPIQVNAALRLLERAGYIAYDAEADNKARVRFLLDRDELYRLRETSPGEDAVVTALLRNYGGMFSDYVYVDEALLAAHAQRTTHETYVILKELSRRRIIDFIPRKQIPLITYLQRREEEERVTIPKEVYEDRKRQFKGRIEDVVRYATNDRVCRSRQLLAYFGERQSRDCGLCDVCQAHRHEAGKKDSLKSAEESILTFLSDGEPHPIRQLHNLELPTGLIDEALRHLLAEERLHIDGFSIRKA